MVHRPRRLLAGSKFSDEHNNSCQVARVAFAFGEIGRGELLVSTGAKLERASSIHEVTSLLRGPLCKAECLLQVFDARLVAQSLICCGQCLVARPAKAAVFRCVVAHLAWVGALEPSGCSNLNRLSEVRAAAGR
jgi:hypothetical protein